MILKIVTAKSEAEAEDTGTFADGLFQYLGLEQTVAKRDRSTHERDYGTGRKVAETVVGLA